MRLMLIWGSSRQARAGGKVVDWLKSKIEADGRFELDFVDLRELNLPIFDEEQSPFDMESLNDYKNPQSKAWAERVAAAEAVIFITPEYNRSIPGVLKNAIDSVGKPWVDKPAGIVSYGGLSGGMIAAAHLRLIAVEIGLVQAAYWIAFPYFRRIFDEQGQLDRANYYDAQAKKLFDELVRLQQAFSRPADTSPAS